MADRRRLNPPSGGTAPPIFFPSPTSAESLPAERPLRRRKPYELRRIFLKTGLVPSASGSAYLELEQSVPSNTLTRTFLPPRSSLKLSCAIHGPKPLPRSAPFSPHLILSASVRLAPFATRLRRANVRDANERDLGFHLETALRGVIIGDRWPKTGLEVIVTVLETEDDRWWADELSSGPSHGTTGGWGTMTLLAGCITVASAALADAAVDCLDLVSGGVAAIVSDTERKSEEAKGAASNMSPEKSIVMDPCPSEHEQITAACLVAYSAARDEVTELWVKGDPGLESDSLITRAVESAAAARGVLEEAVKETVEAKFRANKSETNKTRQS